MREAGKDLGMGPSGEDGSGGAARLKLVEGISGVWRYHLSESSGTGPALCGNTQVMATMIPLSNWMDKRPSHIPSSYCKACDGVLKARSAPAKQGPTSHPLPPNLETP
jgi:hypothetical protein